MAHFGGFSRDFAMPHVFLRWIGTVVAVRNYLSCEQADHTVNVAMSVHVAISWCCYLLIAYLQSPSRISSFARFRRFFFSLPEFHIWCSTVAALNVAIVTSFFLPKSDVILAVSCYIVAFHGWLFCIAFEAFRSKRHNRATNENNTLEALDYLALNTTIYPNRKRK